MYANVCMCVLTKFRGEGGPEQLKEDTYFQSWEQVVGYNNNIQLKDGFKLKCGFTLYR